VSNRQLGETLLAGKAKYIEKLCPASQFSMAEITLAGSVIAILIDSRA
jgi:hypothetical protein